MPISRRPQASGHHGAHLALPSAINCYFLKVKGFIDLEVREDLPLVIKRAAQYDVIDIETQNVSLEEIFLAYYGTGNGGNDE